MEPRLIPIAFSMTLKDTRSYGIVANSLNASVRIF